MYELNCNDCRYRDIQLARSPCDKCITEGWNLQQLHEWENERRINGTDHCEPK